MENKVIYKRDLTKAITNLIPEFKLITFNPYVNKPRAIVNVIVQSITEALQRGETVKIAGFGIFDIFERKGHAKVISYFSGKPNQLKNPPRVLVNLPNKKVVRFTPSKLISRELNKEPKNVT